MSFSKGKKKIIKNMIFNFNCNFKHATGDQCTCNYKKYHIYIALLQNKES